MKLREKVMKKIIILMEEEAKNFIESYEIDDFIEYCFYNEKIDTLIHAKVREAIKDDIMSTVKKEANQLVINAIEKKEI